MDGEALRPGLFRLEVRRQGLVCGGDLLHDSSSSFSISLSFLKKLEGIFPDCFREASFRLGLFVRYDCRGLAFDDVCRDGTRSMVESTKLSPDHAGICCRTIA